MFSSLPPLSQLHEKPLDFQTFGHKEIPGKSDTQAVQDFASEVIGLLLEPLSESLTSTTSLDDDEDEEANRVNASLFHELTRSGWGKALVQGGQFKALVDALHTTLKERETMPAQEIHVQRLIRDV